MALSVGVASPQGGQQGSVYWIGANNNVYVKGADGQVVNQGQANGTSRANLELNGSKQIADPNPPMQNTSTKTANTTAASGGAAAPVLNTAAIGATQQALDSLGTESSVGNQSIDDNLRSVTGKYDQEASRNRADYEESSVTNNQNLQKNKQNSLVAASQGLRGLRSTLSAMGALGGTGIESANRVVTDGANDDIGEAADTFAGNQTGLDKSLRTFEDEDRDRRAEAQTSAVNSKTALEGSVASKRQQYLQKMAELYSEGGQAGRAGEFLSQAGALNNEIATKSRVAATPITERAATYSPDDMDSYLAGAGDMTVGVTAGGNGGVGDAATSVLAARKKDREKLVA